jgi:hypothetical protein
VFLTTYDDLIGRAGRCSNQLRIRVENPESRYKEVAYDPSREDER